MLNTSGASTLRTGHFLRQISHGDDEIGFALIGSETSTGSARCAWAATVLSVVATADREGDAGRFSGMLSTTEEQPANRKQSNIVRSIRTPPRSQQGTGRGLQVQSNAVDVPASLHAGWPGLSCEHRPEKR